MGGLADRNSANACLPANAYQNYGGEDEVKAAKFEPGRYAHQTLAHTEALLGRQSQQIVIVIQTIKRGVDAKNFSDEDDVGDKRLIPPRPCAFYTPYKSLLTSILAPLGDENSGRMNVG